MRSRVDQASRACGAKQRRENQPGVGRRARLDSRRFRSTLCAFTDALFLVLPALWRTCRDGLIRLLCWLLASGQVARRSIALLFCRRVACCVFVLCAAVCADLPRASRAAVRGRAVRILPSHASVQRSEQRATQSREQREEAGSAMGRRREREAEHTLMIDPHPALPSGRRRCAATLLRSALTREDPLRWSLRSSSPRATVSHSSAQSMSHVLITHAVC